MRQEDLNEIMWNSLPQWRKNQLAAEDEDTAKKVIGELEKNLEKLGAENKWLRGYIEILEEQLIESRRIMK
jgi:hypothetical protein